RCKGPQMERGEQPAERVPLYVSRQHRKRAAGECCNAAARRGTWPRLFDKGQMAAAGRRLGTAVVGIATPLGALLADLLLESIDNGVGNVFGPDHALLI